MDLEKEIKLLKEKVELLEKVKELQDMIKANERITYVPYPVYPWEPWQPYRITWNPNTSVDTRTTAGANFILAMGASGNI